MIFATKPKLYKSGNRDAIELLHQLTVTLTRASKIYL